MKTNLYSKIWLALTICLIQTLNCQTKADKSATTETISSKQIRIQLGAKPFTTKEIRATKPQTLTSPVNQQTESAEKNKKIQTAEKENLSPVAIRFQIETYENSGLNNREQFKNNMAEIKTLLSGQVISQTMNNHINELIHDSERNLKLATEMREEAHAENQPAVIAGRLSNADEKEMIALSEQNEVINLLDKHKSPGLTFR